MNDPIYHVITTENREFLVELLEEVRQYQEGFFEPVLDEADIERALGILGEEP